MKSDEVFGVLETMLDGLDLSESQINRISEMLDTIKAWEIAVNHYAKGHYDRGVIARQALAAMSEKDFKYLKQMAAFSNWPKGPRSFES